MAKRAVVMPTAKRPELLALSLERLRASLPSDCSVTIYLDYGGNNEETRFVRDVYLPQAEIIQQPEHVRALSGCWNILQSLKGGYESGASFIYLIEEDVMVYPQYFTWNKSIQGTSPYISSTKFAACGRWPAQYGKERFYTNPGACLSRGLLGCIVPHINDEFFKDRRGYMNSIFGEMDEASDLDDGLIRRVIRSTQANVYYPLKPVVAHQGFHAYQRFVEYKNKGTIQERIQNLRSMLETVNPEGRYTRDFEPYASK